MKIKPLNDWAVIVPSEPMTRTAGGLFIPDSAKETPAEGTVEAIGPGALEEERWEDRKKEKGKKKERKFIPTSVKPGERVMYDRFAGSKVEVGGEERLLVREKHILGILPPAAARPKEDLPPLMLPSATSSDSSTEIVERKTTAVLVKKEARRTPVKPARKKAVKKKPATAKKAATKAVKPKKAASGKSAAKKGKKKR
jgi:chaperonin GroES